MMRHRSRTLYWDGTRGGASYGTDIVLTLAHAPRLNGGLVDQIDYAPLVGSAMVLERPDGEWRRLTATERADLDERLASMRRLGLSVWE